MSITGSVLGKAIEDMIDTWNQFINVHRDRWLQIPVPTPDHIKEQTEVCCKHYRDAALDVSTQLSRLNMMWEIERKDEYDAERIADLKRALKRQRTMLEKACATLQGRSDDFFNDPSSTS